MRPDTSSRGDAYDNATAAGSFATIERELLPRPRFASHAEARLTAFRYVGGRYDPHSPRSARAARSPLAFVGPHHPGSRPGSTAGS